MQEPHTLMWKWGESGRPDASLVAALDRGEGTSLWLGMDGEWLCVVDDESVFERLFVTCMELA